MQIIEKFEFDEKEARITLADGCGVVTLNRVNGIVTFDTVLRRLKIRLISGAKFYLGEAAGYPGWQYVRLAMPSGYGPVRSLGRALTGDMSAKLFVEIANECVENP